MINKKSQFFVISGVFIFLAVFFLYNLQISNQYIQTQHQSDMIDNIIYETCYLGSQTHGSLLQERYDEFSDNLLYYCDDLNFFCNMTAIYINPRNQNPSRITLDDFEYHFNYSNYYHNLEDVFNCSKYDFEYIHTGDGSLENPYQIRTIKQLDNIRNDTSAHYVLMRNINLNVTPYNESFGWLPITTGSGNDRFKGTFDGNGFMIINLYINRSETDYVGLFGYIDHQSSIKNLGLLNYNIVGRDYVGSIAGYTRADVLNSYSMGVVLGRNNVGGLIGYNWGHINNSYSESNVNGDGRVGGLVGYNRDLISNSYSSSMVFGNNNVGGLVGAKHNLGNCMSSYFDSEISGISNSICGDSRTTTQMKDINNFVDWNIALIENHTTRMWFIDNEIDYPRLIWQGIWI